MNFDSLNIILTIAAFIVGIMLLTGHGDIFLKGETRTSVRSFMMKRRWQKQVELRLF